MNVQKTLHISLDIFYKPENNYLWEELAFFLLKMIIIIHFDQINIKLLLNNKILTLNYLKSLYNEHKLCLYWGKYAIIQNGGSERGTELGIKGGQTSSFLTFSLCLSNCYF